MMRTRPMARRAAPRSQQGVMLIEALVAILIFTLGIVALMGLQANSIVQVGQAKYRTDASYLASQIIGQMWVDQGTPPFPCSVHCAGPNLVSYTSPSYIGRQAWDALVASTLPNGAATIAVNDNLVTVTITWKQPEDIVTHRNVTVANLTQTQP